MLEFHHAVVVLVDSVLGWDISRSGGELHILGRLRIYRIISLISHRANCSDGINGTVDFLTHLGEKVPTIFLRSGGHAYPTRKKIFLPRGCYQALY